MLDKRVRILVIGVLLVLCGLSVSSIRNLSFNYDFEAFFPVDNEIIDFYNFFRSQFEPDDNMVLVGVEAPGHSIYDTAFLQQLHAFTLAATSSTPHIIDGLSITTLQRPVIAAGAMLSVPAVHLNNSTRLPSDSAKLAHDPRTINRLVGNDHRSAIVLLKTEGRLDLKAANELRHSLDSLVAAHGFPEARIAGRSYYQALLAEKSQEEFVLYTLFSSILVFVVLILLFRKVWGVAIAMVSVLLSLLLFIGFLGAQHKVLDPMSNLFPILMLIVGVSDVIHIMTKYIDEQNKGITRERAIRITIREIGMATFLTSATTAIGFASLLSSNIPPIRTFGITAAIGVFIAFFTIIIATPTLTGFFDVRQIIRRKRRKSTWDIIMQWLYILTRKRQQALLAGGALFVMLCLVGISQVSTNVHLEQVFPRDDKVRDDFRYLEERFNGIRALEVAIMPTGERDVYSPDVLRHTALLEDYLDTYGAIASPVSPATFFKALHQASYGDNPAYYALPDDNRTFGRYARMVARAPGSTINILVSEDKKYGRLTARYTDVGSDSGKAIRSSIESWIAENLDSSVATFKITGTSLLFDKNSDYVRNNMIRGLGLAFLIVSLLMALLFRNWKMVIISLVPNVIPLLVSGALIGFLGIELDAATSIIFAIAFGIAVDDTIHFLSKFKLELNKGKSNEEAIRSTFMESGKAIMITTIILFFGFFTLIASSYPPTHYIGLLISLTLFSALAADLLLTPVLIYKMMGRKNKA